jgi:hypothetical protein
VFRPTGSGHCTPVPDVISQCHGLSLRAPGPTTLSPSSHGRSDAFVSVRLGLPRHRRCRSTSWRCCCWSPLPSRRSSPSSRRDLVPLHVSNFASNRQTCGQCPASCRQLGGSFQAGTPARLWSVGLCRHDIGIIPVGWDACNSAGCGYGCLHDALIHRVARDKAMSLTTTQREVQDEQAIAPGQ